MDGAPDLAEIRKAFARQRHEANCHKPLIEALEGLIEVRPHNLLNLPAKERAAWVRARDALAAAKGEPS
jgi:hypothetical protein